MPESSSDESRAKNDPPEKVFRIDGAESTDHELMQEIHQQKESAFRTFYIRHRAIVFTLCYRILGDQHLAEDVLSEVFWEIWKTPDRYDSSRGAPRSYLLMMARSRSIDRMREKARNMRLVTQSREQASNSGNEFQTDLQSSRALEIDENREQVREALQKLDESQRSALELAFYEGMSHQQISNHLDLPLGTVKSRIRQGLIKLRGSLARFFSDHT